MPNKEFINGWRKVIEETSLMQDISDNERKVEIIDYFEYDIQPTENGEIILVFKVRDIDCEMKIPKRDLERMLWFANRG